MNLNINFLQKFKTKKVFKKENNQIDPNKFWNALLSVFFLIFLGGAVFGYFTFQNLTKDLAVNTENDQNSVGTNQRNKIKNIIEYFDQKQANSGKILESETLIIDPSL